MAKSGSVKTVTLVASCLVSAWFAHGAALAQGAAKPDASPPDFYQNGIGWIANGNDFLPPKSGLGPVTFDPAHPYRPNGGPGGGPTFRVSDLSHPALMPW